MTKQSISKIMIAILISMMGVNTFAYDIAVKNADGVTIYYNYINDAKELEVTYNNNTNWGSYGGNVVIPEEVTYMNRTRKVTSIGGGAFSYCYSLTSVTIPNSVTSIGSSAFGGCRGLTTISIPNSVTSIGSSAFSSCYGLTTISIPNSVTYIGNEAFENCDGLTSVTIPNSVTFIGSSTFYRCSRLTSVIIPNSVASIDNWAFYECSSLASVTIPNSVTSIGKEAFYKCSNLTSVTIPNSVTSIGIGAFEYCSGLTSVTIGNSVTSIGSWAFGGADIPTVISLIENPFIISSTFSNNTYKNATLYVPKGTIDKYKATEGWKDFLFIEEGTGPNGGGETPETKKCATPTIGYQNGKLTFNCETEGVTCQYTITDDDVRSGSANELQLGVTYHISVYATKEGFDNSDIATATLCWIDVEPKTEGITNGVANVRALPLLIQSNGSTLTISGAVDGTPITVYSINGTEAGSAVSQNGTATISTALQSGSAAIVKVGNKSVKVVVK